MKKANIFRSPDQRTGAKGSKNSSRQSSRKSSEGSPENSLTDNLASTPAVEAGPVLVLPTPEEIINTPSKTSRDKAGFIYFLNLSSTFC